MARIEVIAPGRASSELADAYRYNREIAGGELIANIVRIFSLRPESVRRMLRSWELAMWFDDEPRATREFAAAAVSRLNACAY